MGKWWKLRSHTVYFNTAHISVMLQAKDMCDIITTIHELFSTGGRHFKFGHFGKTIFRIGKDFAHVGILDSQHRSSICGE